MMTYRDFGRLTYKSSFLWKIAIFLLIVSLILAYSFSSPQKDINSDISNDADIFLEVQKNAPDLYLLYLNALQQQRVSVEKLKAAADNEPPEKYANMLWGIVLLNSGYKNEGALYLLKEVECHKGPSLAGESGVAILAGLEDYKALGMYVDNSDFNEYFPAELKMRIALRSGKLQKTFIAAVNVVINTSPFKIILALLAFVFWFFLIMRFRGISKLKELNPFFLAAALGFIGVIPSMVITYYLYDYFSFANVGHSADLTNTVIKVFLNTALKEQAIKMLLFLPFIPFLAKKYNERDALLLASVLGLGFAAGNNLLLLKGGVVTMPVLLVTTNFLHVASTGICALALYQEVRHRTNNQHLFLMTFLKIVAMHFCFVITSEIESIASYRYFSMMALVIMGYVFFNELHKLNVIISMVISQTFLFLCGLLTLNGICLIYSSYNIGFSETFDAMFTSMLGSILILVLYIREFREQIR